MISRIKETPELLARASQLLAGDYVNTRQAAELVCVSHFTVSAWLSQGKLRRYKAGGRTLIKRKDLEDFVRGEVRCSA
jgi:excisionase family DNA binding protein